MIGLVLAADIAASTRFATKVDVVLRIVMKNEAVMRLIALESVLRVIICV